MSVHECMQLCAYMKCVLCVSIYLYMLNKYAYVCLFAHTLLCVLNSVLYVFQRRADCFLKFTCLCLYCLSINMGNNFELYSCLGLFG